MSTIEQSAPIDLYAFFNKVGRFRAQRALNAAPAERPEVETPVELLEEAKAIKIEAAPLAAAAYVDGIQASITVAHRVHRPVYLFWVAAAAVGEGPTIHRLHEQLTLVCSFTDKEWVDSINTGTPSIPVAEVHVTTPPDVEASAYRLLGSSRSRMEQRLVEDLVEQGCGTLVLDGSLVGRPHHQELVGVVKTTLRKYLPDESVLFGMRQGWRSPIFRIPAGVAGCGIDRFSCYVRLTDAAYERWNFGLIRVEAYNPDVLDALAARCMAERQMAGVGDARYDRHLAGVRAVEDVLRARRPHVFAG